MKHLIDKFLKVSIFFAAYIHCSYGISAVYGSENAKKINVYFMGWNILTPGAITPESIKIQRHVYMEIYDYALILKFEDNLNKLSCKDFTNKEIGDIRLAFEIIENSKVVNSIYATKEYIYIGNKLCKNSKEFYRVFNIF